VGPGEPLTGVEVVQPHALTMSRRPRARKGPKSTGPSQLAAQEPEQAGVHVVRRLFTEEVPGPDGAGA
jgi:hypothetical protein